MLHTMQNCMIEISYKSKKVYANPFADIELWVIATCGDSVKVKIPAFWAGGQTWRVRYASPKAGIHRLQSICSDTSNADLHGKEEIIQVDRYEGDNPLLKHGPLKVDENKRYLQHLDGTPFFWLGDTWWMGLSKRLKWPDDFKTLTADRAEKGFTVIQIAAGLYPDMVPFDERGSNEAGFPWTEDFTRINPEYFDIADRRIEWLVGSGLLPCIVGCWGYYIEFAGTEVLKRHWNYICARYGAYPVVWCMAGEALMPFYGSKDWTGEKREKYRRLWNNKDARNQYQDMARKKWTEVTVYLKSIDPYNHPVTIHPTDFGHKMLDDPSLLDIDMLQTGHGSWNSFSRTVDMVEEASAFLPKIPVINGEVCYEGIGGSCFEDVQRFVFWAGILSGAAGHTYGADGVWQVNTREQLFGASPQGVVWGNNIWEDAYKLPGSKQIGVGKKFLERFEWWKLEPHSDWCEPHSHQDCRIAPYAAGIPGKLRLIFIPFNIRELVLKKLEAGVSYRGYYFNPANGDIYPIGIISGDDAGDWIPETPIPVFSDILMVLEEINSYSPENALHAEEVTGRTDLNNP